MDSWISFWLAELTEPPASPIYLVLFVAFLVLGTLGIYAFRGIPHWIIESRQSRLLRVFAANIAIVALIGASILVLQSMSVPLVSRRLWLGLAVLVLGLHLLALLGLRRWLRRRPSSDSGSDFTDLQVLH
jgi:hypothetical protein